MYNLEDRREMEDMIETFKYIKGESKVLEGHIFNIKQKSRRWGHDRREVQK